MTFLVLLLVCFAPLAHSSGEVKVFSTGSSTTMDCGGAAATFQVDYVKPSAFKSGDVLIAKLSRVTIPLTGPAYTSPMGEVARVTFPDTQFRFKLARSSPNTWYFYDKTNFTVTLSLASNNSVNSVPASGAEIAPVLQRVCPGISWVCTLGEIGCVCNAGRVCDNSRAPNDCVDAVCERPATPAPTPRRVMSMLDLTTLGQSRWCKVPFPDWSTFVGFYTGGGCFSFGENSFDTTVGELRTFDSRSCNGQLWRVPEVCGDTVMNLQEGTVVAFSDANCTRVRSVMTFDLNLCSVPKIAATNLVSPTALRCVDNGTAFDCSSYVLATYPQLPCEEALRRTAIWPAQFLYDGKCHRSDFFNGFYKVLGRPPTTTLTPTPIQTPTSPGPTQSPDGGGSTTTESNPAGTPSPSAFVDGGELTTTTTSTQLASEARAATSTGHGLRALRVFDVVLMSVLISTIARRCA
jgi:hypothetical protein